MKKMISKLSKARIALKKAEEKRFFKSTQHGGRNDWVNVGQTERQKELIKRVLRAEAKILGSKKSWDLKNDKVGAALLKVYDAEKELHGNTYNYFTDEDYASTYALARIAIKLGKARKLNREVQLTPLEKKILSKYSGINFT